jgi:hypothetical protein
MVTAPTIVQLVLVNETGDSYYRMRWPGHELAKRNPQWRILNLDAQAQERYDWAMEADLLVLFQSMDYDLIPIIEERRKLGRKTIAEYNDNFYSPPTASPLLKEWNSPFLWQSYEAVMRACDAVMVTGEGLRKLFSQKTDKEIVMVRNFLPIDFTLPDISTLPDRALRIGWAGSQGHAADLIALRPLFQELTEEFPDLTIHLMGNEAFQGILGLPPQRVVFRPWGTMADYFDFLRKVDLGIIATLDTPYNQCRSDIKAVELGGCGAVPLIPDILPYKDIARQMNIKPYRSLAELKAQIVTLVSENKKFIRTRQKVTEYVANNRIGDVTKERSSLYTRCLPKKFSEFSWPVPVGYYELQGNAENVTRAATALRGAQALINGKDFLNAMVLLDREYRKNIFHPEIGVAWLRSQMLANISIENLRKNAQDLMDRFPSDIRFLVVALDIFDEDRWIPLWEKIIAVLRTVPPRARGSLVELVSRPAARELRRNPDFIDTAIHLTTVLPQPYRLHLELSSALRNVKRTSEAITHLDKVFRAKEDLERSKAFLESVDLQVLGAELEGLQGALTEHKPSRGKKSTDNSSR